MHGLGKTSAHSVSNSTPFRRQALLPASSVFRMVADIFGAPDGGKTDEDANEIDKSPREIKHPKTK